MSFPNSHDACQHRSVVEYLRLFFFYFSYSDYNFSLLSADILDFTAFAAVLSLFIRYDGLMKIKGLLFFSLANPLLFLAARMEEWKNTHLLLFPPDLFSFFSLGKDLF